MVRSFVSLSGPDRHSACLETSHQSSVKVSNWRVPLRPPRSLSWCTWLPNWNMNWWEHNVPAAWACRLPWLRLSGSLRGGGNAFDLQSPHPLWSWSPLGSVFQWLAFPTMSVTCALNQTFNISRWRETRIGAVCFCGEAKSTIPKRSRCSTHYVSSNRILLARGKENPLITHRAAGAVTLMSTTHLGSIAV